MSKQVLACSKEINELGTSTHRYIWYKNSKGNVSIITIYRKIKLFTKRKCIEWTDKIRYYYELHKVAGYKINTQHSMPFPYKNANNYKIYS